VIGILIRVAAYWFRIFVLLIVDSLLNDCLVTYIERDIFFQVNEEDIIETFMTLKKCGPDK
jgi:hypothetical protein